MNDRPANRDPALEPDRPHFAVEAQRLLRTLARESQTGQARVRLLRIRARDAAWDWLAL